MTEKEYMRDKCEMKKLPRPQIMPTINKWQKKNNRDIKQVDTNPYGDSKR